MFAFVSTPLWCSTVLIAMHDFKSIPLLPDGAPPEPGTNETNSSSLPRVVYLERQLQLAREEAEKNKQRVAALEADLGAQVSAIVAEIDAIPAQGVLTFVSAIMGLLAIVGPSTYLRGFISIVGSAVAALLVAGCVGFFTGISANPFFLDGVANVARGQGGPVEYVLFFAVLILGIARWVTGWECGFYIEEEEEEEDDGNSLQKPLLQGRDGPGMPPPLAPPPVVAGENRDPV